MDKITIYTSNRTRIDKNDFSSILNKIYEKASNVAFKLSKDYIRQNQRIDIYFDENTGGYHLEFFNCTDKYGRDFAAMFQDKFRFK